jgi:hypothetical protein
VQDQRIDMLTRLACSGEVLHYYDDQQRLHREDGPAVEWTNYRLNMPMIPQRWCRHGCPHREDGPAIEWPNGSVEWYYNGHLHRDGGPAMTDRNGSFWFNHGKRHRVDGPAVEWANSTVDYYILGQRLTEDEFYRYVDQLNGEVLIPPGKKLKHDKK